MANWADRLAKLAQSLATAGTVPDTSISTAETDVALRLAPDGAGGVEWGTGGAVTIELDYVEFTSSVSVTATTEATANTVVTANAEAFDGSTIALIEFSSFSVRPRSDATGSLSLYLYDGAASIGRIGIAATPAAAASNRPVHIVHRLTPSNASHTYSIRAAVTGGTGDVGAGAGGSGANMPGFIRISKVI